MNLLDEYKEELRAVRAAIMKLTIDPTTTTSVSSANGGSYSASYMDLAKLHLRENELVTRIAELYRAENGGGDLSMSYHIYCGG